MRCILAWKVWFHYFDTVSALASERYYFVWQRSKNKKARCIAVNILIYQQCGHTAFSLVHTTIYLDWKQRGWDQGTTTIDDDIIICQNIFVPTEEYPKQLYWIGTVTVFFVTDKLLAPVCMCVCSPVGMPDVWRMKKCLWILFFFHVVVVLLICVCWLSRILSQHNWYFN